MKVGVCQTYPKFGLVHENVNNACRALNNLEADLVILPELFNSGYQFTSKQEAKMLSEEIPEGFTTQALAQIAKEKGFYIVAGLAEKDDFHIYNSAVLIGPSGHMATHRKAHLFFEEKLWFDPGNTEFIVHDIGVAKIGIMICFEWIFPEVARILTLKGVQILCQPANLIFTLCHKTMIARAIENRIFTVTANRVGFEERKDSKRLTFTGLSQIVDPRGNLLCQLSQDQEESSIVEIDPDVASDKMFNEYNHLIKDRRIDLYKEIIS